MTATRVFLYEFVTGGGCWSLGSQDRVPSSVSRLQCSEPHGGRSNCQAAPPGETMLAEGLAMLRSLALDLLAIGDLELHLLADTRLTPFWPDGCIVHQVRDQSDERRLVQTVAASSDVTVLIAPEFDHLLLDRCRWVAAAGGKLVSPEGKFVALAADKQRLAEHLLAAGIPLPRSATWHYGEPPPTGFPFPAVLKPVDGAGSLDVRLIDDPSALLHCGRARQTWRLEQFQEGISASVGVLCGPNRNLVLQPGRQLLSSDGQFKYLGGQWPLDARFRDRAVQLAARVAEAMPSTQGYIGIDLVLAPSNEGSDDVVIEVNPRLTTSYVGLRQLATSNLAAEMLRVAQGRPARVSWRDDKLTLELKSMPPGVHTCNG